jgi:tRNA G18 (ribose-2'-O)-methylase SpoU
MRAVHITGAEDPRVADYADLREPRRIAARGLFVLESRQCVQRALRAGRFRLRSVLVSEAALGALGPDLAALADPPPVFVAEPAVLRAVAGFDFHRGCVALGVRRPDDDAGSLLESIGPGPATLIVLERVSNPDNVGGIFRNALAFGAAGVLLSPGAGDPLYRKAVRVSLGITVALPFARAAAWPHDLGRLRDAGFRLLALTPAGDDVADLDVGGAERLALVVGAEGDGLSAGAREHCDAAVGIPMAPAVDSLNAATATGIALWALRRRDGAIAGAARSWIMRDEGS